MKVFVWVSLFILIACSSYPPYRVDTSKVLPYQFSLESNKVLPSPYVAQFNHGTKSLYYVLSKHVSEKEYPNLLNHPTLKTIKELFSRFQPEIVLVEGINTADTLSPKHLLKHAKKCELRNYKGCGESFYSISQAKHHDAHYMSGEPSDAAVLSEIKQAGYNTDDLLGFYLVRQIPQMKRRNEFHPKKFKEAANHFLDKYKKRLKVNTSFNHDQFEKWYQLHMKRPKSYYDISNNDTAPHGGNEATYVQKISHQVGLIRDKMITKRIAQLINRFDRVLVVYGGSHYLVQEPALKAILGTPKFYALYPEKSFITLP